MEEGEIKELLKAVFKESIATGTFREALGEPQIKIPDSTYEDLIDRLNKSLDRKIPHAIYDKLDDADSGIIGIDMAIGFAVKHYMEETLHSYVKEILEEERKGNKSPRVLAAFEWFKQKNFIKKYEMAASPEALGF